MMDIEQVSRTVIMNVFNNLIEELRVDILAVTVMAVADVQITK